MTDHDAQPAQPMHVDRDGPRDAPPLLFIHGSGASGASWGPVVPALAARHHVVRIDLPGCGQSPPARSYDVAAQAGRVAALLDELGLRAVTVVGHSSGGYVATALAEQRHDLVGSLAMISTGPRLDALLPQPAILRALLAPPFGPLLWRRRSDAMLRKSIGATLAGPAAIPPGMVADLRSTTYRAFRDVLRENSAYLAEQSVPERLTALGLPVLVVFGAADPRWDPASARQYDIVPDVRVEMLPGVGHMPMLEAPEAVGRLLLDFVTPCSGTASAGPA
ncbi:alpha/beta fold hydrolase [Streptomyces coffeae]|uniref:Alpha/beta fold hydrolase n=1 Tax=Streptomyces coffeae TaxID=621382 RepID=A0ABS1N9L1_9ACTN|nr:alpha/beta fold hydrolase [Streptomyces coffeae]MBL1096782.1 alpha/beta fold hydrolase [Streptomyces coffeae]